MNKSIDGTADDEEEGVPTEEAIRAGLELLKVKISYVVATAAQLYDVAWVQRLTEIEYLQE